MRDLEKSGWLGVPALMIQINNASSAVQKASAIMPTWVAEREVNASIGVDSLSPESRLRQNFNQIISPIGSVLGSISVAGPNQPDRVTGDLLFRTLRSLGVFPQVNLNEGSTIQQLRLWGENVMTAGAMLWTGSQVLGMTGNVVTKINDMIVGGERPDAASRGQTGTTSKIVTPSSLFGQILGGLGAMASVLGGIMVLVGIVYAYVLPMLPIILFIVFAVGALILVVEAFLAAPLWALAHVNASGRGFIGERQSLGYHILFSLFLRIPIAVAAFIFSIVATDVAVFAVQWMFSHSWNIITEGNAGVFGFIAALLMFTFLTWIIVLRSYSMITDLPDRVLRWMGLQSAAPEREDSMRGAVGVAVMGLSRAGGALTSGVSTAISRNGRPAGPPRLELANGPSGGGGLPGLPGPGGGGGGGGPMGGGGPSPISKIPPRGALAAMSGAATGIAMAASRSDSGTGPLPSKIPPAGRRDRDL